MGRRAGWAFGGVCGNGVEDGGVFGNGVADGCGTSARYCAERGCGLPVQAYVNAAARRAMSGSVYAANRAEAHVPSSLRRPPTANALVEAVWVVALEAGAVEGVEDRTSVVSVEEGGVLARGTIELARSESAHGAGRKVLT